MTDQNLKYKGINDAGRRTGSSMIINTSTMSNVQHTWVDVKFAVFPCTRECRFSRFEISKIWRQGAVLTRGYIWCSMRVEEVSPCPGFNNFTVPRFLSFGVRHYFIHECITRKSMPWHSCYYFSVSGWFTMYARKATFRVGECLSYHTQTLYMETIVDSFEVQAWHNICVDSGTDEHCYCVYAWLYAWCIFLMRVVVDGPFQRLEEFVYSNIYTKIGNSC